MSNVTVNVTPYMQGSQVKWDLEIVGTGKHGGYGNYPGIQVAKGDSNVDMKFTIINGQGWTFAKDSAALWVSDNGQDPSGPSMVPAQINPKTIHTSPDGSELKFVDANAKPAGTLHYTLNLIKNNEPSSTLDPIINNGGPGFVRNELVFLAVGAVAVIAIAVLIWSLIRSKNQF